MSGTWRLLRGEVSEEPALGYALERAIAECVGQGGAPPTLRLWHPGRCLALGRFDGKLPRFEDAVQHMKGQGVVLLQRLSGGKAVWQDEGYLNFSVIAPRERVGIPEAYKIFSQGVIDGLRRLGVESHFKHVEGAFCDGPYDLAVEGRKLVGTAQVQKRGFMSVHGTLLVDCDVDEMVRIISEFYELAGAPLRLRAETMITLREALGRAIPLDELVRALVEGYRCSLGTRIESGPLGEGEWERANALIDDVVL